MNPAPSGRLYSAVTKRWPGIATGLVVVLGVIELVAGGLTADSRVEAYLTAWAATTGGLWFMFEKAERTLSDEVRRAVAKKVTKAEAAERIKAIPTQFALLFDRVFGERKLSEDFFGRSCVASVVASLIVFALLVAVGAVAPESEVVFMLPWVTVTLILVAVVSPWAERRFGKRGPIVTGLLFGVALSAFTAVAERAAPGTTAFQFAGGAWAAAGAYAIFSALNFLPDYVSLIETRVVIGFMERTGRFWLPLVADVVLTWLAWAIIPITVLVFWPELVGPLVGATIPDQPLVLLLPHRLVEWLFLAERSADVGAVLKVSFLSTFLTSLWLWAYALALGASWVLLRMNSGVGLLLRVTDVERQPFRSMGFVSVIIVSVLFALGLPVVLL